jgi:hypothetical protein
MPRKQKERSAAEKNTKVGSLQTAHNSRVVHRPEDRPRPCQVFFVLFSGTLLAFEGRVSRRAKTRPPSRSLSQATSQHGKRCAVIAPTALSVGVEKKGDSRKR